MNTPSEAKARAALDFLITNAAARFKTFAQGTFHSDARASYATDNFEKVLRGDANAYLATLSPQDRSGDAREVERIATAVMAWAKPHLKHIVAFSTLCEAIEAALSLSQDSSEGVDPELIERLRKRYTPEPIPPCTICGEPLSIQRAGGHEATLWACSVVAKKPIEWDNDHYGRSQWYQSRTGDSDVLELLAVLGSQHRSAEVEALKHDLGRCMARENDFLNQLETLRSAPDGWVLVPREPTTAMHSAGNAAQLDVDQTDTRKIYRAMLAAAPSTPSKGRGA